ncbi:hypothetical protein [Flagellimonas sp.]|uniref:hypothetical protein n=1 Tax=Flagellimonas sp. TaxID=2058762 RepID=UPI0034BD5400
MTYKIKSLLYFCAFLISATIYYGVEQYEEFQQHIQNGEVVETQFADTLEHNETQEESLKSSQ